MTSEQRDFTTDDHEFEGAVAAFLAGAGGRAVYQGARHVVVVSGRPVNHVLHLLLCIPTLGLWALAWIGIGLTGGEQWHTLSLDDDGELLVEAGARLR